MQLEHSGGLEGQSSPVVHVNGLPLCSQYMVLTGIGAPILGTVGQFVQEIQQIYQSFQRTVSIPLNLHNKDYMTIMLLHKLTEVR